ncbi:MAG TPA: RagB/SusD family nutrient uptake outer membrane protein [Puia sp.]|nr:RagB/SusD family nutrient uptake outer membrane protein [Puia sp.]
MKKYNQYIAPFLLGLMALGSCQKKDLYPVPQTAVSDASAFSTAGRIQSQVLSLYGALKAGGFYGGRYVIDGDIKADNFINEQSNLVTGADVWNENPTNSATAVTGLWSAAYLTINACNLFIDGMNAGGTKVVGPTAAGNYISEAKLIRALSYYSLLQYYALPYANNNGANKGLPLRLTGIKSGGFSLLARSPVDSIYTQILSDLNDAEAGLPLSNGSAYNNVTRAHRNTAIALKTRVYLSMQNYNAVITEANKIVGPSAPFTSPSGVTFALQSDITKVFVAPYTTSESILSLPMSSTTGDNPGTQNQLGFYFSPSKGAVSGGTGNGEYSLNPAGVIADPKWTATDRRRTFIVTSTTGGKKWLNKYPAPSPYTDFPIVIRYSEVLLSLAEARVRSTNSIDAQAVALLNAVRSRSDATTTYTVASFAGTSDLINAILQERNIEFLGEGLRNNDLMRLQLTVPAKGSAPAKSPSDVGYIWPISATELSLNTLCTDN